MFFRRLPPGIKSRNGDDDGAVAIALLARLACLFRYRFHLRKI
jgi:hypothetical protein